MVHNSLTNALVLTVADMADGARLSCAVRDYLRRLRRGGVIDQQAPYLWVTEVEHCRPHIHLTLPAVDVNAARQEWRLGTTKFETLPDIDGIRGHATYLSKDFHLSSSGSQRYRAAQGFKPEPILLPAQSMSAGIEAASSVMGMEPETIADIGDGCAVRIMWTDTRV